MVSPTLAERRFELSSSLGEPITGELRYDPTAGKPAPVVIICHSFMAFKDWGFFPHAAGEIARRGFPTVAFNFSLNGVVSSGNRITDFAKFERNTISQEIDDLRKVTDAVAANAWNVGAMDPGRIVYLGHSRGGGIAITCAAADERLSGLVTWSSISTFDRWTAHQKALWESAGSLPLSRDTSASPLRMGIGFLRDLGQNPGRSPVASAPNVKVPWLILHGGADVTVSPREAETLYRAADKSRTDLAVVDGVGHLYNGDVLDKIIDTTIHWLRSHFP